MNQCVRRHLEERSLTVGLQNYEIAYIRQIAKPDDENIGDQLFHQGNFESSKHNLVVKLRPLGGSIHTN